MAHRSSSPLRVLAFAATGLFLAGVAVGAEPGLAKFQHEVAPTLENYCYDCHGEGNAKGGVTLDEFSSDHQLLDQKLWLRALKNLRAGMMPPAGKDQPTTEEKTALLKWIKDQVFQIDAKNLDPGRVTVRRLNRIEYRNTIRELLRVDYDTINEFPADDTGHGFDNIADVLTISPMLLEKYLDAAQTIVARAVPIESRVIAEHEIAGREFHSTAPSLAAIEAPKHLEALTSVESGGGSDPTSGPPVPRPALQTGKIEKNALDLFYYTPASVAAGYHATHTGKYQLLVDLRAVEQYVDGDADLNKCRLKFSADGEVLLDHEFARENSRAFHFALEHNWTEGDHQLTVEIQPTTAHLEKTRQLRIRLEAVTIKGPVEQEYWVLPKRYAQFFPGAVPTESSARLAYARKVLGDFASRAFRHPVDDAVLDRLTDLASQSAAQPHTTFEAGIAQAMTAVLASPRFLFREDKVEPLAAGEKYPVIDEYSLASRLSYFLWSSMPDPELFDLAARHQLRANLKSQVQRMLADPKSKEFVGNFTGQWLEARDVGTVPIDDLSVFLRENPSPELENARAKFRRFSKLDRAKLTPEQKAEFAEARKVFGSLQRQKRPKLTDSLRREMQQETEMLFETIVKEDRSVVDLIDADYAHLNEELANYYGIPGVTGREMRKVMLPPDSFRGGVLTQGTVLAVTSNPTRTSPVKRGLFILDNILGSPPAPPPPNIPPLESAASEEQLRHLSLRDTLALHASNKSCAACHSRMDPLGLALENFNAMGAYRDKEMGLPVSPGGQLITGEKFDDIRGLKKILAHEHRTDFYYCLSDKLLTYALGRGLEYYDTETLDRLVSKLQAADGHFSALLMGIIESTPFQKSRFPESNFTEQTSASSNGATTVANLKP